MTIEQPNDADDHTISEGQASCEEVRFLHKVHRDEIMHHRQVMIATFKWASGLFLAIPGGVFVLNEQTAYKSTTTAIFAVLSIIVLSVVSTKMIRRSALAIDENAQIVVKCSRAQRYFTYQPPPVSEPLYPSAWQGWGTTMKSGHYTEHYRWSILFLSALSAIAVLLRAFA